VFCPYASSPYRDKFTVFASLDDMANSTNPGFCVLNSEEGRVKVRANANEYETVLGTDTTTDSALRDLMAAVMKDYAYCL
jgi:putative selenate reductase